MIPIRSIGTAHPGRPLDRVVGRSAIFGLSLAAMPATGIAGALPSAPAGQTSFALVDPVELGDALGRGELPVELLVAGSVLALAVGFALTLLVASLRRRRSGQDPDLGPAQSPDGDLVTRTTLPWPVQDVDAFQSDTRPDAAPPTTDDKESGPSHGDGWAVTLDAATTGAEPSAAADDSIDRAADAPPTWERNDARLSPAEMATIESALELRAHSPAARSALGTPGTPLVVTFHDGRLERADRHGLNLPLVAAIGAVAVGVAIGATVALRRGRRR